MYKSNIVPTDLAVACPGVGGSVGAVCVEKVDSSSGSNSFKEDVEPLKLPWEASPLLGGNGERDGVLATMGVTVCEDISLRHVGSKGKLTLDSLGSESVVTSS